MWSALPVGTGGFTAAVSASCSFLSGSSFNSRASEPAIRCVMWFVRVVSASVLVFREWSEFLAKDFQLLPAKFIETLTQGHDGGHHTLRH